MEIWSAQGQSEEYGSEAAFSLTTKLLASFGGHFWGYVLQHACSLKDTGGECMSISGDRLFPDIG